MGKKQMLKSEKIRRDQHTLVILGNGVILFGVWSFVKAILSLWLTPSVYMQGADPSVGKITIVIAVLIALVVDLLLRFFVGRSARNVGLGKKTHIAYIGAAVLLMILYVISTGGMFYQFFVQQNNMFESLINLIIDITSFIILLELVIASVKVKRRSRHAD